MGPYGAGSRNRQIRTAFCKASSPSGGPADPFLRVQRWDLRFPTARSVRAIWAPGFLKRRRKEGERESFLRALFHVIFSSLRPRFRNNLLLSVRRLQDSHTLVRVTVA